MFFKNTKEESTEVNRLMSKIEEIRKEAEKEAYDTKVSHDKEKANLKMDQEIVLKRKDAEVDVIVSEKTKSLTDKVAKLELENGTYKKEVDILTKAFENLGFDVKDMKEILNKLVDGIVSKNSIQLVK